MTLEELREIADSMAEIMEALCGDMPPLTEEDIEQMYIDHQETDPVAAGHLSWNGDT